MDGLGLVSADELARHLGVSGKALRAWLRQEVRLGNLLVASHVRHRRWLFTSDAARALAEQYRSRRGRRKTHSHATGRGLIAIEAAGASINWDPRQEFHAHGFAGFTPLKLAVRTRGLTDPDRLLDACGVYAIFAPLNWSPRWRSGRLTNVITPWPVERLRDRWVEDVELVYIGCAGRTKSSRILRKRLEDLLKHGAGSITSSGPHKGGERIWQCVGWEKFTLAWRPTGPYPEPHNLEVAIGNRFVELTGSYPFANEQL
jgi:hypothetical protein